MNRLFFLIAMLALAFFCCTKSDNASVLAEDSGCIEKIIIPVSAHSISDVDINIVNNLFLKNGIENNKYRYFQYTHDSLQTLFVPYTKYDEKGVKADQYANGLRIFNEDVVFLFFNDTLHYRSASRSNTANLNTTSSLTVWQLRKLFIGNIEKFDHTGNQYKDSCFKTEFGYFNLNGGTADTTENLVKAWRVTLKNSYYPSEYPIAYYQDNGGKLISYNNGILSFH